MKLLSTHFYKAIVVATLLFLIPSTSFARKYYFEEGYTFKVNQVDVKVEKIVILGSWSGMSISLSITNNGDGEYIFPVDDFEILNAKTNEAFYSCTKDNRMVTVPQTAGSINILAAGTKVNAHRTIKGNILILATGDELKSLSEFNINFEKQTLKVTSNR